MTPDELSKAWNKLRNAALGRGMSPNVPPALAARVEREWKAWRKAHLTPDFKIAAPTFTYRWTKRYKSLLKAVQRAGAGKKIEVPFKTPLEELGDSFSNFGRNIAITVGVVGGVYVLIALVTSGGGRRRDGY